MLNTLKTILTKEAEKKDLDDFNYPILYSLVRIALDKDGFARDRLAAMKMLMPYLDRLNAIEEEAKEGAQLELDFEALDRVMIKRALEGDVSAYNAVVRKATSLEEEDENDYQVVKRLVVTPVDMSKPREDEEEKED